MSAVVLKSRKDSMADNPTPEALARRVFGLIMLALAVEIAVMVYFDFVQ
jgi:hypothetical protein